jgi:hypothetical protein
MMYMMYHHPPTQQQRGPISAYLHTRTVMAARSMMRPMVWWTTALAERHAMRRRAEACSWHDIRNSRLRQLPEADNACKPAATVTIGNRSGYIVPR